ncbi:MAG: hypothetical protein ACTSUK_01025 [Promethearchaeota archaeon]
MYIKTKNAVDYNLPMKGTASSVISGVIEVVSEDKGLEHMKLKYAYYNDAAQPVNSGIAEYTKADLDALMNLIKGDLPDVMKTEWTLWRKTQLYTAFIIVMAEKLEISPEEIEIVTEEQD